MKNLLFLFILLIFISCDEENEIIEPKILEEIDLPFTINKLFPEYSFWGHGFGLTLNIEKDFNANNVKCFFNGFEIKPFEVNNTGEQFIQLFEMPYDAYSDSLEIRFYKNKDSISVFTRYFEVVNSEIKIDVDKIKTTTCKNNQIITGKGLKYAKYISYIYKRKYDNTSGFDEPNIYDNNKNLKDYYYLPFESVDNNTAKCNFVNANVFGIRIMAADSIKSANHPAHQIHAYPFVYMSNEPMKIESPEIVNAYTKDNYVFIEFKRWYNFKNSNYIKMGSIDIDRNSINFQAYSEMYSGYNLVSQNGLLSFEIPNNATSNEITLTFECVEDTKIILPNNSYFKNVNIDIYGTLLDLNYTTIPVGYEDAVVKKGNIDINFINLKSTFNSNSNYKINSSNVKGKSFNNDDVFYNNITGHFNLIEITEDIINFEIFFKHSSSVSGNNVSAGSEEFKIIYKGKYEYNLIDNIKVIIFNKEYISQFIYEILDKGGWGPYGTIAIRYEGILGEIDFKDDAYIRIELENW